MEGNRLQTRYGVIGTDGRLGAARELESPERARMEAGRRMASKTRDGYQRVDDDTSEQRVNPELAAAIVRSEDEADQDGGEGVAGGDGGESAVGSGGGVQSEIGPYLVYGDWLQSAGDPRGELIAIHNQQRLRPDDPALAASERRLLRQHGFLPGRLAALLERGLERAERRGRRGADGDAQCSVQWRLGFIRRARIGRDASRPPYTVRELCAALFAHPSAQVLHGLTIGPLGPSGEFDYRPVIGEIARAAPRSLRELYLGDFGSEHTELAASRLGDVGAVFRRLPGLRRLHLRAGTMILGEMGLPGLRHLAITIFAMDDGHFRAITGGPWRSLRSFALRVAGSPLPPDSFAEFLASPGLARLARLRLTGTGATHDLWRAVVESPLSRTIEAIDLSSGTLTDRDVHELIMERQALLRLQRLEVSSNMLSAHAVGELRQAFAEVGVEVVAGDQREPAIGRPVMTEHEIYQFAPDAQSMTAARRIAWPRNWPDAGSRGAVLWGRCQGRDLYDVCVDTDAMESECTCPSMKRPCKHAIALLMLAQRQPVPEHSPPEGFIGEHIQDAPRF